MSDRIEHLLAELYEADPSLQDKEGVLRPLLHELLAANPTVELAPAFRMALKERLMSQARPAAWTRLPSWVYYPLAGVALAILVLVVRRPTSAPGPVVALREPAPASSSGPSPETEMQTLSFSAPTTDVGFAKMKSMQLTSSAFENGAAIPAQYTCDGASTPPPLVMSDVPADTASLVLIVHDPDAPRDGGFTHWVVFNIAPDATAMQGTDGANGAGKPGYVGPCPPSGTHHYIFQLSALDVILDLKPGASEQDVRAAMDAHVIGQTELIGTYQRQ